MTEPHTIPVSQAVGRIDWYGTANFLYGIDSKGSVIRFIPLARGARKPGMLAPHRRRIPKHRKP